MEQKYKVNVIYGKKELDVYSIPPLFVITSYPSLNFMFNHLAETVNFRDIKKAKKHMAAQIILGQPFNYRN